MSTISIEPNEKGTAIVTLVFTDEDGAVVVPKSAAWQLMKTDGNIVNNRAFADCAFTGTKVVLSGTDLAFFSEADQGKRIFAIQITYDSNIGDNLPHNDEIEFKINRLVSQTVETL